MNNQILFLLTFLLSISSSLSAQDTIRTNLANVTIEAGSGQVCVPMVAENFLRIAGMQFSFVWDASVLEYASTDLGDNPLGIANNGFFTPTDSTWGISVLTNTPGGISLDPGTTILSLCFTPLTSNGSSVISFDSYLAEEFIQDGEFMVSPFVTTNGSVTITPPTGFTVLPGDTNLDSLVNADDLLNIGLGFGQTGPERVNASTAFAAQSSSPWPATTPATEVNFAHADTDGNGVININDQAVMESNYGQSIANLQEPTNGLFSRLNLPFIYLVSDTLIGGQVATIDVFLGDEANPVNAGHGLSFSLQLSPSEFDLSSVSVDYSTSFLGNDLLTFNSFYPNEPGLLEIALSRKDQQNSAQAGGKVCTITLTPIQTGGDFEAEVLITPYRYIDAAESTTELTSAITSVVVLNSVSVREPLWATGLIISPNPATTGFISIEGINQIARVELFDLTGRLVSSNYSTNRINTSNLAVGTYFLRLSKEGQIVVRKIVVQ